MVEQGCKFNCAPKFYIWIICRINFTKFGCGLVGYGWEIAQGMEYFIEVLM